MSQLSIKQLLEGFSKLKVLIIGDVMVDSYLWGKVSRISPEAPVPIITQTKKEFRMGGAANVAQNIKSLGAEPVLCSVIGNDSNSYVFLDLMKKQAMPSQGILQSEKRVTTVKTRIISGSQQLLRIDHETEDYLNEKIEDQLFQKISSILKTQPIHAIIFQDYDKGVITPNLIEKVTNLANISKIPTLVDPKKRNFNLYRNVTLFKPNFKELVEGLNIQVEKKDLDSIYHAAKLLHAKASFSMVMVTLSEHGILISDNISYDHIPGEVHDITDVSGAGDTVISMAALCLASGMSAKQIAVLSNLAGGLVCEKVGVVPIEKEQLIKEDFTIPEE